MPPASLLRTVHLGNTTVSMTRMTPLLAATSVFTTLALSTVTVPSSTLMLSSFPLTIACFVLNLVQVSQAFGRITVSMT